jgi:hypothetical protein
MLLTGIELERLRSVGREYPLTPAMRVYVLLHTRPSFCLTMRECNLINGQIESLPQRFAWSKKARFKANFVRFPPPLTAAVGAPLAG